MKVGKLGLEKTLENYLIGTNDIQRYEVNAYGKRINQLEYQKGKQGSKIRLTVDTESPKTFCINYWQDKSWINKCNGYLYRRNCRHVFFTFL